MEEVIRELEKKREFLKNSLLSKNYDAILSLLNDACTKHMQTRREYDICNITPYSDQVSEELQIEYVNASFIPFEDITYIACQHPKQRYHPRFHEFIEKSNASIIVSLTEKSLYFEKEHIITEKEVRCDGQLCLYDEECVFGENMVRIQRIKCQTWKDHSVLSSKEMDFLCDYIGQAIKKMRTSRELSGKIQKRPIHIIHCKAGVGRTGTFIMYMQLRKLKDVTVDVFLDNLIYLRAHRAYMVENSCQLRFLAEHFLFSQNL